jgi:XTP/dITP diphosphohydrolase
MAPLLLLLYFATSNQGKLREARRVLEPLGFSVQNEDIKGVEIQADTTGQVAAYSSRAAARSLGRPVIVEDAGLFVEELGGFPGVYSAYVFKTLGVQGIITLLGAAAAQGKKKTTRAARFASSVAYCEPEGEPRIFDGWVEGTIAERPRGTGGFGFDPIFIPAGQGMTFGELSIDAKSAVSHRGVALRKFAEWYLSQGHGSV